jgi:hypothetical protein
LKIFHWAHFRGIQTLAGLAPETGLSVSIPHKPLCSLLRDFHFNPLREDRLGVNPANNAHRLYGRLLDGDKGQERETRICGVGLRSVAGRPLPAWKEKYAFYELPVMIRPSYFDKILSRKLVAGAGVLP